MYFHFMLQYLLNTGEGQEKAVVGVANILWRYFSSNMIKKRADGMQESTLKLCFDIIAFKISFALKLHWNWSHGYCSALNMC